MRHPTRHDALRQLAEVRPRAVTEPLLHRAAHREGRGALQESVPDPVGLDDPLDRRVVEAYWVGNGLLERTPAFAMGGSMEERFRHRAGPHFGQLAEGVVAGGVPHHSFHVFCVYPWTGLLGDDRRADHALTVLDRCRIRGARWSA